jgi:hypothetical protein
LSRECQSTLVLVAQRRVVFDRWCLRRATPLDRKRSVAAKGLAVWCCSSKRTALFSVHEWYTFPRVFSFSVVNAKPPLNAHNSKFVSAHKRSPTLREHWSKKTR